MEHQKQRPTMERPDSIRSLISAPPAPPEQHSLTSLTPRQMSAPSQGPSSELGGSMTFGGVSSYAAHRYIRRAEKQALSQRMGWEEVARFVKGSSRENGLSVRNHGNSTASNIIGEDCVEGAVVTADEETALIGNHERNLSNFSIPENDGTAFEALKAMFTDNSINLLLIFLPFAYWSHLYHWNESTIFILNFLAMVPLASMLGVFTEELAAHTNDVIGGLINATFGNTVELVVAIQALLVDDYRVVQASLIGSVFSNMLLVLGTCFFVGGLRFSEQKFMALGSLASIALLGLSGLALYLPQQFENNEEDIVTISRIGALLLVAMYGQLLFFQLKTHIHFLDGDDSNSEVLIPFSWALIGLVVITAIVTVLSEFLVGSIDGFCEEFHLGKSFVGVIILPIVGNAVEHISAVTVAYKNKMDLALGVALGSSVQIALFVLPMVVIIGWFTGKEMTLNFPSFEVHLYMISVVLVSLCLSNQRTNWLEGSLLISTYVIVAVGIYFEKDVAGTGAD